MMSGYNGNLTYDNAPKRVDDTLEFSDPRNLDKQQSNSKSRLS